MGGVLTQQACIAWKVVSVLGEKCAQKSAGWFQVEGGAGPQRTLNMLFIFVTPEVFQLDMSALKFFMSWKSHSISETPETSQWATGPYVAIAAVGLAL